MSSNNGNRSAGTPPKGILRERSLNVPVNVTTTRHTTPSTLSSNSSTHHVQFDQDLIGRLERTSILALACMPPTDSDDEGDPPPAARGYRTAEEEEQEHDLNDLADYNGDSDDEGEHADDVLANMVTFNEQRFSDTAVAHDDGYTACDNTISREEQMIEQQSEQAPMTLPGAPVGWKPPGPPDDWKGPGKARTKLGQPDVDFKSIDNPGGWSSFTFRPKFLWVNKKPTKFLHYAMPADATPVPKNADGKRTVNGFEFYHNGWTREINDPSFRSGATRNNLFPSCRKGSLDGDVLAMLGLTKERMLNNKDNAPDAFFFWQLLFPIHDIANNGSGIDDDPRKGHCPHVTECTEVYAITELKLRGSGRGHRFKETSPQEMVRWDGVLVFDGALGGSNGAILRRFDRRRPDNSSFNKLIADSMTPTRWLETKRAIKLNNNLTATRKGDPNHNPAQKYDFIFNTLVHNTNALTKHSCLDLSGDETTWIHAGWAEPGSGIINSRIEKPGGPKGGQLAVVSDVDRIRIRAYVHRHKLHPKHFSHEGANEVKLICDQLLEMVDDGTMHAPYNPQRDPDVWSPKKMLREKPHITWDNCFSGDQMMTYAAEKGIGITCTVNRGRLPKGTPSKYLHKSRTDVDPRSKAARFENPIVAIKRDPDHWGTSVWQHTSFQSTSSCNISHVNAINTCSLFAKQKERGRALFKRTWAIEMNESRQLCLQTHGKIDKIDHMVKNCNLYYRQSLCSTFVFTMSFINKLCCRCL